MPGTAPPERAATDDSADTGASRPVVVFDLDGTLVDTAPDLAASLNQCLQRRNLPPTDLALVRPHAGHGSRVMLREAYRRLGLPLTDAEMEDQVACFLAHYAENIAQQSRPFPGAVAALDRLAAGRFTLAVCTNKSERLADLLLAELRLKDRFAAICGADTVARKKPDPSHLTETLARAGGAATAALMVGDTATDIDAAAAAGIPSVLVDFGYAPDAAARARATLVIEDYAALDAACATRLIEAAASKP
ncbi:HAD-IA family hydrolase [Jiella sp. M17.18]|uniref:HAD-IA family hydrolase n=1 Tax=Jiella sp. M17.18 TaxID=3234247 RepID=UPI0034DDEA70